MANEGAKILVWDVETSPNLGYTWAKWQQDVIRFKEQWALLSVAWKWYGESKTHVLALNDFPDYQKGNLDDRRLTIELHKLLDSADITIAHNGDRFDMRKAQARFIVHGLTPPSPSKQIDTLKAARKAFLFNSNTLDDLGAVLGVGRKVSTGGFDLWLSCMSGDEDAWNRMKKYNKQDVRLLEDVYTRLRPWIAGHPNVGVYSGDLDVCPKCGSSNITKQGFKYNRTTKMQQYKCNDCGGWASSRCAEKDDKPSLVN
jgi:hypothetical protein